MKMKAQVLSDEDILKIHATSLEIMEKLGIHPHTYKHFRKEHFIPSVSDRNMLATWQENGEQEVRIRAREVIEERLDAYQKPHITDSIEQTLEDIIQKWIS